MYEFFSLFKKYVHFIAWPFKDTNVTDDLVWFTLDWQIASERNVLSASCFSWLNKSSNNVNKLPTGYAQIFLYNQQICMADFANDGNYWDRDWKKAASTFLFGNFSFGMSKKLGQVDLTLCTCIFSWMQIILTRR